MTEKRGKAWRQSIFYPFQHASLFGRGDVLLPIISSPVYDSQDYSDVPYLEAAAVWQEEKKELTIFAVNRDWQEGMVLETELKGFSDVRLIEHIVLEHPDLKAVNSKDHPDTIVPQANGETKITDNKVTSILNKLSWNVIRLRQDPVSINISRN
mgnify:CR=1 FL=1